MPLIDASLVLTYLHVHGSSFIYPRSPPASPPGARWAGSLPCAMIGDRSLETGPLTGGLAWIAPGELQLVLDLAQDSNPTFAQMVDPTPSVEAAPRCT